VLAVDPAIRRYLPSFAIAVDDISRQSDEELKARISELFAQ